MRSNESALQEDISEWLPTEIDVHGRRQLLERLIEDTLGPLDDAIEYDANDSASTSGQGDDADADSTGFEGQEEQGEEQPGRDASSENLLDRLLYKGVLPRYAFPTDVATFHVFDPERSSYYRPAFRFTPSQGLPVALSQYAPGKEVWIASKLWTSGAVYSPLRNDRYRSWQTRRLYYECKSCRYALTTLLEDGERGERKDCEACGGVSTLGPAKYWLRPPGVCASGKQTGRHFA